MEGRLQAAEATGMEKKRYGFPDSVRGAALCSMILYHAVWDLSYIFDVGIGWYEETWGYVWQQSICWTFIFLSGFCSELGRRSVKRGLTVLAAGALIWVVTLMFMPQQTIKFGVLTLIGSSMIITAILGKLMGRIRASAGFLCALSLFFITRNVNGGYLGFERFDIAEIPEWLYRNDMTAYLGFPGPGFSSADYFSVIPWFFLFAAGAFLCLWMKEKDVLAGIPDIRIPVLDIMGKHSLGIYMIHQPLIYFILTLYFNS